MKGKKVENNVQDQEISKLIFSVDDDILEIVLDLLASNRRYIDSQDRTGKEAGRTEIKITLGEKYKYMTLNDFMSKLKYNQPFRKHIDIETLEYLSQYELNQDSLKYVLRSTDDPWLLEAVLDRLDRPANLNEIKSLEVMGIYPELSLKLLNMGLNKNVLFSIILNQEQNYNIDIQVKNINELILHKKFSWDEVKNTLEDIYWFGIEIDLLEKLVEDCQMPVAKALLLSQRCVVNKLSVMCPSSKDRYEDFVKSMCIKAKDLNVDLNNIYIELKGFSPEALKNMLNSGFQEIYIFHEIFRQISEDREGCDQQICFIKEYAQGAVQHLVAYPESLELLTVKSTIKLYDEDCFSADDIASIVISYFDAYYDDTTRIICYRSIDENELEEIINKIGLEAFNNKLQEKIINVQETITDGVKIKLLPSDSQIKWFFDQQVISEDLVELYGNDL